MINDALTCAGDVLYTYAVSARFVHLEAFVANASERPECIDANAIFTQLRYHLAFVNIWKLLLMKA